MPDTNTNPILLYDGVCGLCNRLNQFLLKRDTNDRLRFASLQSEFAGSILKRHNLNPEDLDTVYVVLNHDRSDERVLARSDAILHALTALGGIWSASRVGVVIPRWVRNKLYDLVAGNRYRVFGKHDSCLMPDPRYRHKFLDHSFSVSQGLNHVDY